MVLTVRVKHTTGLFEVELAEDATLRDLQAALEARTRVPLAKQRVIFSGGRKVTQADCKLRDKGIPLAPPPGNVPTCMLIGAPEVAVAASDHGSVADGAAEDGRLQEMLPHLVSRRQTVPEGELCCSYADGYVPQDAFLCRTCADNGWCSADHVVCLGCAELCHKGHQLEEWGPRLLMRCDCCTTRFTHPKHACRFIVDERTQEPPLPPLRMPANDAARNRYPRDSAHWCYCKSAGGGPPPGSPVSSPNTAGAGRGTGSSASAFAASSCSAKKAVKTAVPVAAEEATEDKATVPVVADDGDDDWEDVDEEEEEQQQQQQQKKKKDYSDSKPMQNPTNDDDDGELEDDDHGQTCLICNQSFLGSHLRVLMTHHFRSVPCYGQVLKGQVAAFACRTCGVDVCAPCRLRCHKDHDVAEVPHFPTKQNPSNPPPHTTANTGFYESSNTDDGQQGSGGGSNNFIFSCGCGGRCAIAEGVPDSEYDTMVPVPAIVCKALLDEDVFMCFVCSWCAQEHPWLITDRLGKCYKGTLPPKREALLPVLKCEADSLEGIDMTKVFPAHGLLMPVGCFGPSFSCSCDDCQRMFEQLCPGSTTQGGQQQEAPELFFPKFHLCSNCSASIERGYVCMTCELAQTGSSSSPGGGSGGGVPQLFGGGESYYLCAECYSRRATLHNPSHELVEDSFDNLWRLFGASLVRFVDPATQRWMVDHWEDSRGMMFDFMRGWLTKRVRDDGDNSGRDDDDNDEDEAGAGASGGGGTSAAE